VKRVGSVAIEASLMCRPPKNDAMGKKGVGKVGPKHTRG